MMQKDTGRFSLIEGGRAALESEILDDILSGRSRLAHAKMANLARSARLDVVTADGGCEVGLPPAGRYDLLPAGQ